MTSWQTIDWQRHERWVRVAGRWANVVEMLIGLYRSAETGQTVNFPAPKMEDYVPPVARPRA